MIVQFESELTGPLELDSETGFRGEISLSDADGVPVALQLDIFEEVIGDSLLLARVAPTVDSLGMLLERARGAFLVNLATESSLVLDFAEFHADELNDETLRQALAQFRGDDAGSSEALVDRFTIKACVFPGAGEPNFWLDYSLFPDQSDAVLAVKFDADSQVTAIDWES